MSLLMVTLSFNLDTLVIESEVLRRHNGYRPLHGAAKNAVLRRKELASVHGHLARAHSLAVSGIVSTSTRDAQFKAVCAKHGLDTDLHVPNNGNWELFKVGRKVYFYVPLTPLSEI